MRDEARRRALPAAGRALLPPGVLGSFLPRGVTPLPPETSSKALKGPDGRKRSAKAVKQFWIDTKAALGCARGEVALASVQHLSEPLMRLARLATKYYADAKRACGVLDNDDLLHLLARAFREHPDIAAEYSERFRLVMVDEFQDTNAQQVSMVKRLSGEDACHLTTVGDAQQSIYGFRGADVSVFEDRSAEVAKTVRLDTNFRSDDAILRFVARACGDTGIVPSSMDLHPKPTRKSDFPEDTCPRVVVELTRAHRLGAVPVKREARTRIAAAQLADRLARIREQGRGTEAHGRADAHPHGCGRLHRRPAQARPRKSVVTGAARPLSERA